jgi:hypothetical protein
LLRVRNRHPQRLDLADGSRSRIDHVGLVGHRIVDADDRDGLARLPRTYRAQGLLAPRPTCGIAIKRRFIALHDAIAVRERLRRLGNRSSTVRLTFDDGPRHATGRTEHVDLRAE